MPEKEGKTTEVLPAIRVPRWLFIWLVIMAFASPMLVASASAWYTTKTAADNRARFHQVQTQADKRWCDLFGALDSPPNPKVKDPVQRARTERAQKLFHKLRIDLGCIKP